MCYPDRQAHHIKPVIWTIARSDNTSVLKYQRLRDPNHETHR